MPDRVTRSEARSDALDRYAAAAAEANGAYNGPRLTYSNKAVAASDDAARRVPITMGPYVQLDGLTDETNQDATQKRDAYLAQRASERRAAVGLPSEDVTNMQSNDPGQTENVEPSQKEIFETIVSFVSQAANGRKGSMDKTAMPKNTISNMIDSLDLLPNRKSWLISRVQNGIRNADLFARDLHMSMRR